MVYEFKQLNAIHAQTRWFHLLVAEWWACYNEAKREIVLEMLFEIEPHIRNSHLNRVSL
jgi:hypothetical protein